jgi:hypothetical protein
MLKTQHSILQRSRARMFPPFAFSRRSAYNLPTEMLLRMLALSIVMFLGLPLYAVFSGQALLGTDYRTADRSSAGIAPPAETTPEAVVHVYAARAVNWRGIFGVHTWIATKPENATSYTVHHVIGWRLYRNLSAVHSAPGIPDGRWFGNEPEVLAELRGEAAARAIPQIIEAVESYPYANEYAVWPGPNSNTFTAYVARQVADLSVHLPATAIGKDYPVNGSVIDRTPSGTGYQLTVMGLAGLSLARDEGFEVNLLGLTFGVDLFYPALKLPFVGRLGLKGRAQSASLTY